MAQRITKQIPRRIPRQIPKQLPPGGTNAVLPGISSETKFNDPYQINSVIDVLFNTAGLKKAYGNASVGTRFKALWDMNKKQYWEPMFRGEFGTVATNTLFQLGEVLDIFGNPVKAITAPGLDVLKDVTYEEATQVVAAVQDKQAYEYTKPDGTLGYSMWVDNKIKHVSAKEYKLYEAYVNSGQTVDLSKLTTNERLKASIGFGEYGHINFDYNTGNVFTDILLEVISDPETLITLGAAAVGKLTAEGAGQGLKLFAKNADDIVTKAGLDVASEAVARNAVVQLTDDVVRKKMSKEITKLIRGKAVKIEAGNTALNAVVRDILGDAVKTNKVFNVYKLSDANEAIRFIFAKQGLDVSWLKNADVSELLQRSMAKHVNRMNLNVVRGLDTFKSGIDKTQSLLVKSALSPTGVYPTYAILKKAGPGVASLVRHKAVDAAELLNNKFGNRPMLAYLDGDYVLKRSSRTVKDMLTDDLKYLYKEADNVRVLEKQAVQDMQVLQTWARKLQGGDGLKQAAALRAYIKESQGLELEELADTIRGVIAKADKPNEVLARYLEFVEQIVPVVKQVEDFSSKLESVKKAEAVFDLLFQNADKPVGGPADVGRIGTYYGDLSDKVYNLITTSKHGATTGDIAALLDQEKNKLLREFSEALAVLEDDPQARNMIDLYMQTLNKQLTEQNENIHNSLKLLFDYDDLVDPNAVYRIDRYDLDELFKNKLFKKPGKFDIADLQKQALFESNEEVYGVIGEEISRFFSDEIPRAIEYVLKNITNPDIYKFGTSFRIVEQSLMKNLKTMLSSFSGISEKSAAMNTAFLLEFKELLDEELVKALQYTDYAKKFIYPLQYTGAVPTGFEIEDILSQYYKNTVSTTFPTEKINTGKIERLFNSFKADMNKEMLDQIDIGAAETMLETVRKTRTVKNMGLFSPEAIAELRAEAIKTADIFEQTYFQNMFPVMFKDVDSLGDKAVDELIGKQAAFGENYKKVINAMNLLDDKKYGAKALETKEVSKEIAEAFPTVAVGNPEFKEELLNSLEEAFTMFDDFKIYVEPPNRSRLNILPEVWEKPEEMLGEASYSFEGFAQLLDEFVNTPINDIAYEDLYNTVLKTLENVSTTLNMLRPKDIESSLEITTIVQNAIDMLSTEIYNPRVFFAKQSKLLAYELLVQIKRENFADLLEILSEDVINDIVTDLRVGPFSDLIRNIIKDYDSVSDSIRVLQEFDFGAAIDPAMVSEKMAKNTEVYRAALKVSDSLSTFDSTHRLVTAVQNSSIDLNTKANFFATIMKFHGVSVESFQTNPNYWVDQILKEMPQYTNYTKKYTRKLKLTSLETDPEFMETIAEVRRKVGATSVQGAQHTAAADILPTLGVLYKKADDDPVLAEKLKDTLVLGMDIEAMNVKVSPDQNAVHQIGFQIQKNREHISTVTCTLEDGMLRKMAPDGDYLLELRNAAEYQAVSDSIKFVPETYRPLTDYTHESLVDFYVDRMGKEAGERAATEAEVLLKSLKEVHDVVKSQAFVDPVTGKYKVVLVAHNGDEFDIPFLKRKMHALNLYDLAANSEEYAFDLHFLDNIETIDTLAYLRKADDYYVVPGTEEAYLREALLHYFSSLGNASKAFTAFTSNDLNRIMNLTGLLKKEIVDKSGDANLAAHLLQLQGKVKAAKEYIGETIFGRKEIMKTQIFPAAIFQDKKYMAPWYKVMRDQLDLTEDEIIRRFGDNMSNMGLSSIMAASGDFQSYAYNYLVNPKLMDRFFIGSFTRTQLGELSVEEGAALTKAARILGNLADGVRNYDVHASYQDEMHYAIKKLLDSDPVKFVKLKYLRTDGLNIPETWAVLKYISQYYDDTKGFLKALYGVDSPADLTGRQKSLLLLLQDGQKFQNLALDKYELLLNGDTHSVTQAYLSSLNDVLNLKKSLSALSEYADEEGLLGGGALIQMKALEPVTEVLSELQSWLLRTDDATHIKFYQAEQELTNRLAKQIAKEFIDLSSEDTVRWLAQSKGIAVLPISNFQSLGGSNTYLDFITKLGSEEFVASNVEYVVEGKYVWVYLNRSADLKVRLLDGGKLSYYVNGAVVEDFLRPRYSAALFQDVYDGVVSTPALQKAIDAVDYMTDGASCGTVYDMLNKSAFDEIYETLPAAVRDNFYGREFFDNPLLWQNRFNYTVLGDLGARKDLGLSYNGHFLSSLRNATESRINERGVKQVYELSLMNNASAIKGSRIEEVFQTDKKNVAKWFAENPDYTAVATVKDKHHKQGYKIIECRLDTPGGIKKALALNAKIVTYSEYNKLYEVINNNIFSENAGRGWQALLRLFKIGYLATPGTWGRNYLDTFIKNTEATGTNPFTMRRQYASATKLISTYDDSIVALRKLGGGKLPTVGETKLFFKNNSNMDYDTYKMLTSFFSDPAAGGEARLFTKLNAQSRKKYLKEIAGAGSITTTEYTKQMVKTEFDQITNWALSPMNKVERVGRLAAYLTLSEQGHTTDTALRIVEKIHFAYSVKSETEQLLEMAIPFFTFIGRNFSYWMDAIDTNPAYFALLRDILDPALNLEQYDPEELRKNKSLQRAVLSGNIKVPMTDDFHISASLSFMDAFQYLVDPIDQVKGSIFTPVQAFINVWLQNAADENYLTGQEAFSAWLQNTFGLKMTKEEVDAKYGDWAEEYKKLYDYRISNLDPTESALKDFRLTQLIPLIGSQLQRLETTSVYYDDENVLKKTMYLLGLGYKVNRWDDTRISKVINQELGGAINQDKHAMAVYTRLKAAMGYSGIGFDRLPYAVKENIYSLMNGVEMPYELLPVIKDKDAMQFMWNALKQKYDVAQTPIDEIDNSTLNKMYFEVAKGASYVISIQDSLSNDPDSRYAYAVARNKLGLEGLKLYQMPTEALEVISFAMENKLYKPRTRSSFRTPRGSTKSYPKKTYSGGEGPGSRTGYFGVTPYNTTKGVHANYGHAAAQKEIRKYSKNIYSDNYTRTGKSRMELMMIPISPETLKYRRKEMYHYYR